MGSRLHSPELEHTMPTTIEKADVFAQAASTEASAEILFIDDETSILNSLKRLFHEEKAFNCHFASSAAQALEILSAHHIDVIVSDHLMPGMTGTELLSRVKEKRPKAVRMMITGHADLPTVQRAINRGEIYRFILKPWQNEELIQTVRQAAEFGRLRRDNERQAAKIQEQNSELGRLNARLEEQVTSRTKQLADALHTARSLSQKMDDTLYNAVRSMFTVLKFGHPELGSHSLRVADHAVSIGRKLSCNAEELRELEIAALLHDAGKLFLPGELATKDPDTLSDSERESYRKHPAIVREVFKSCPGLAQMSDIIYGHHERYDGSGFPDGTGRSDLRIECYIIGIVDMVDHLLHDSHESAELAFQHAYSTIGSCSDSKFPAKLVQVTMEHFEQLHKLSQSEDVQRLGLADLIPNTTLAADIYTVNGVLLVAAGANLTTHEIAHIRAIHRYDPIQGEILALRKRPAPQG